MSQEEGTVSLEDSPNNPRNLFRDTEDLTERTPAPLAIQIDRALNVELQNEPDETQINEQDENSESTTNSASMSTSNRENDTPLTYELHGVTYTIEAEEHQETANEAVWTKEDRGDLKGKDRVDFIAMIQAKQQRQFHAITISKTDPEKLTNTHSVAKLLEEHRRNLAKYDLLDPYTIVIPTRDSFDVTSSNYRKLTMKKGEPSTFDLHKDYLTLTAKQVAQSSRWYAKFTPKNRLLQEDLLWSAAYYEKNVETSLYNTVHAQWMEYEPMERGGPLFLKLMLDHITTTSEANLKALIHITETYNIKTSCPGEDIDTVVGFIRAVFNNISALKQGDLPAESVRNLLRIFQTTSVDTFNDLFAQLEKQLLTAEIQRAVDPSFVQGLNSTGASVLANEMKSVNFALNFAAKAYRNLVQTGEWDGVLQATPGRSALLASQQPTEFTGNQQAGHVTIVDWTPGACFNCGSKDHILRTCPFPRDKARIEANRAKHPNGSSPRKRGTPSTFKFRNPDEHEHGKRIIDGKPHTWDSTKNNGKGWWVPDVTPSDGQPNNGQPPNTFAQMLQSALRPGCQPETRNDLLLGLLQSTLRSSRPTSNEAGSLTDSSVSSSSEASSQSNKDSVLMAQLLTAIAER